MSGGYRYGVGGLESVGNGVGWFVVGDGRASTMEIWHGATAIDGESGVGEFEIGREDSPSIRFVVHGEGAVESETGRR